MQGMAWKAATLTLAEKHSQPCPCPPSHSDRPGDSQPELSRLSSCFCNHPSPLPPPRGTAKQSRVRKTVYPPCVQVGSCHRFCPATSGKFARSSQKSPTNFLFSLFSLDFHAPSFSSFPSSSQVYTPPFLDGGPGLYLFIPVLKET